ncbi:MAG: adenylate/guanylate cyclase domain-containing protein [Spirochaetia bacterium]|nr:adenylate/guanylate cyclase domain-containing protein [Spirochaetia bacterium]
MNPGTRALTSLEHETLLSERLRAGILAIFFTLSACFFLVLVLSWPDALVRIFGGQFQVWIPPVFFSGVAAYCLFVRFLAGHFFKAGKAMPTVGRYMNSLVETSVPTFALLYLAQFREPANVLLLPPPFVYFIFIILSALRLDIKLCIFTGAVAAFEFGGMSAYFLMHPTGATLDPALTSPGAYIARSFFLLAGGIVTGLVTLQIKKQLTRSLAANLERDRIAGIFGQHVSPQVVDRLLNQTELLSESRHVCMMFLDIRDFTRFSSNKAPEEVVNYLNLLFESMIDIINRNNGIINKFLGDGFMAVFGAPLSTGDDVANAAKASLEIVSTLKSQIASGAIPQTRIGIGLHAGIAVTGHIGTESRKEYTIIGDVVNLASRIEQLNKEYGTEILASEDVWQGLVNPKGAALGEVSVRGRETPVKIYRLD